MIWPDEDLNYYAQRDRRFKASCKEQARRQLNADTEHVFGMCVLIVVTVLLALICAGKILN